MQSYSFIYEIFAWWQSVVTHVNAYHFGRDLVLSTRSRWLRPFGGVGAEPTWPQVTLTCWLCCSFAVGSPLSGEGSLARYVNKTAGIKEIEGKGARDNVPKLGYWQPLLAYKTTVLTLEDIQPWYSPKVRVLTIVIMSKI